MSRQRTPLLIIGAGPTGLAAAISVAKSGVRDFIIVDQASLKDISSRALAIHAATLEALDSIGSAEPLIKLGIKGKGLQVWGRTSPIFTANCFCLEPYTRYPYILLLPQIRTEDVLETQLKALGIQVLRPDKAIGLKEMDNGEFEVTFESGNIIAARYIVAADGARSVIRQLAGIKFTDPDHEAPDERLAQMILADVTFSSDSTHLPKDQVFIVPSENTFLLVVPLPRDPDTHEAAYRIGFNVPLSAGEPPSHPSLEFLQYFVNKQGPIHLSSDSTVNSQPISITKVLWATRFRTHAAIADQFLARFSPKEGDKGDSNRNRGMILLIGDAAHIHSPAGGQGMNLGLRDAVGLGPVLAAHITSTTESFAEKDKALEDFVATRRQKALTTIQLTKRIMSVAGILGSDSSFDLKYWFVRLMGMIPCVQRRAIWNMSGLGNR